VRFLGFQHAGAPRLDNRLLAAIAPDVPTTILVLIIEHIAISKSFGRINNYIIDPSQELVAVGFTNVFGPFLGGYPATGSFSRTAIKSKAGVRTPLAGIFTAVVVLLALYALTSVFYYIPSSSLAALIIHAVGDLITPPETVYQFWKTAPLDVFIFFGGVILTVFTTIENGIYLTMAAAGVVLLWRLARSRGRFLGHVTVYSATAENLRKGGPISSDKPGRDTYAAVNMEDGFNPEIPIQEPYPGVFVYRFSEGFNYINAAQHIDNLTIVVFQKTRRTQLDKFAKIGVSKRNSRSIFKGFVKSANRHEKKKDRPWNDPGPRRGQKIDLQDSRPILRAIILDFSSVNFLDTTSAQALIDLRDQFNRYASPEVVTWHFAGVTNRWTKRALVASGFGYAKPQSDQPWNYIFSVAPIDGAPLTPSIRSNSNDEESGPGEKDAITPHNAQISATTSYSGATAPIYGVNRPFFHVDVASAVESAVFVIKQIESQEDKLLRET
jgi:solute carrier family 26 (sodium-independent sulfate anion transporter), member 11